VDDPPAGKPGVSEELPSIRQLPLLGVKWADLYRQTKIQETVFELLTQQYELAKIEEAKEIPTVKVLDAANVPEKKSFPPRLVIMLMGMFAALSFGSIWVLGIASWQLMDAQSPNRRLGEEVFAASKALTSKLVVRWRSIVRPEHRWVQPSHSDEGAH
jgi:hypothetical protein